jgi:nucleoside-diphosphate-sugar epimerase
MKILVTGGSGYIARNLIPELVTRGHIVGVVSRQLINNSAELNPHLKYYKIETSATLDFLRKIIQDFNPDCIVHLATSWKSTNEDEFLNLCLDTNIKFAINVAGAAHAENIHLINIASYWELNIPCFELRQDVYTTTKRAFSDTLKVLELKNGLKYSTILLYDNYGHSDPRGKLINSLAKAYKNDSQLSIRSSKILLNLLHIRDVVSGICLGVENHNQISSLEISSQKNVSIGILVQQFQDFVGKSLKIDWGFGDLNQTSQVDHEKQYPHPPGWHARHEFPFGLSEIIRES